MTTKTNQTQLNLKDYKEEQFKKISIKWVKDKQEVDNKEIYQLNKDSSQEAKDFKDNYKSIIIREMNHLKKKKK